jgi:hypothetical protein
MSTISVGLVTSKTLANSGACSSSSQVALRGWEANFAKKSETFMILISITHISNQYCSVNGPTHGLFSEPLKHFLNINGCSYHV